VVTDRDAVINELLADHQDDFSSALDALEGCAQYLVKGRYVEETVLREIIGHILEATRDADTRTTLDALAPLTDTVTVREPTHDEDAVQIAVLLEVDRQDELEQALGELAERWDNRVTLQILGPTAPCDFVVTSK
jgi:mannitol/fructose-specific phosphotransferase system IIA component (Ntr-type)